MIEEKRCPNQTPSLLFKKSLLSSRAEKKTKLAEGVRGINRYVEDVESDWLETWSDHEE